MKKLTRLLKRVINKNYSSIIKEKIKGRIISSILAPDYMKEKRYRLELVEQGFENRKNDVIDDVIFERIIASYNKAKSIQLKSESIYQVSNEWLPIYESYMNEIIQALTSPSIDKVSSIYNNFFRESCSVGLHGLPVDMFKHYFEGKINLEDRKLFLDDFIHRIKIWETSLGHSFNIKQLDSPIIGNPYGYSIDDTFIKAGADYLHYYATMISRLVRGNGHKFVLELGAGYGGLPYYLIRDNSDITYLDFDLPENMALTAFYLLSAFPEKKIALYGEIDLITANLEEYDIVLMPNFEISKIQKDSIDLVFNSYSLAEMSLETIDNYLSHFNRIAKKFIFHVNHTKYSVVKADDFKIDLNKFELMYRAPALWNMVRKIDMDEFEYLYKNKQYTFISMDA